MAAGDGLGARLGRMARRGLGALAALAAAALAPGASAFSPDVDYAVHCQGCHLADGRETPGTVPALAGVVGRLARTQEGRAYLVQVPGVATSPLGDAALAHLMNWVVARFGGPDAPADFVPYAAEEIGRLRRAPLVDVETPRRALLP